MRTDRTHYTVPHMEAFDIELHPAPPGMVVNCISCWGVSRQGVPDAHTVAWYPLAKIPASAKRRARQMINPTAPGDGPVAYHCTCDAKDAEWGGHHAAHCWYCIPF